MFPGIGCCEESGGISGALAPWSIFNLKRCVFQIIRWGKEGAFPRKNFFPMCYMFCPPFIMSISRSHCATSSRA